ncbi:hypothetical protein V0288_22390 [Pannus brasiliensis CCIBt3594]|uniref:Uncharacterized protein n=1 Tax=Pannus brasiliensis CCIBt3594 TaxID=1427578 RepID=A0AAW9R0C5_9CHRO
MYTIISLAFIAGALIIGYILGWNDGHNLGWTQGKKEGFRETVQDMARQIDRSFKFEDKE